MIQTTLVPGVPWPQPARPATRDISKTMMAKMLKCVTDNPGLTNEQIAEKCDSTTHYTRRVLRRLREAGKIYKTRKDRDVHYWAVQ